MNDSQRSLVFWLLVVAGLLVAVMLGRYPWKQVLVGNEAAIEGNALAALAALAFIGAAFYVRRGRGRK